MSLESSKKVAILTTCSDVNGHADTNKPIVASMAVLIFSGSLVCLLRGGDCLVHTTYLHKG